MASNESPGYDRRAVSLRSFLHRYRKLWIALGAAMLFVLAAFALLLYWAHGRAVRYPESFRTLVEQKYGAQLDLMEKSALSHLPLSAAEIESLDLPEILDATVWTEQPPEKDGLWTLARKAGHSVVSKKQVRPRYLWLSWLEQEAVMERPALNLVMTAEGSFIEYEKKVAMQGEEVLSYTVTFDPELLERQ